MVAFQAMKLWLFLGGINGALVVTLGAFGAHGLKQRLSEEALNWWQTAVLYHFIHTLLLLAIAILIERIVHGLLPAAAWLTITGILLFSGSLYCMALGAPRWFGAITPIGGLAWILAWLLLAWIGVTAKG